MSEFDDKLSAILNDPNAMGQIMSLAQSLSGPKGGGDGAPSCQPAEQECGEVPLQEMGCPLPDLSPGRDAQLLAALRPYLRPERQGKLDKMLEILQLLRLMRGVGGK